MTLSARVCNAAWVLANRAKHQLFRAALANPRAAQERVFRETIRETRGTRFATEHAITPETSIADYRKRVPLRSYDEFLPFMTRIAEGTQKVLTASPVERFVPSSGSTRSAKMIPYTRTLRKQFARGLAPWINDLFETCPSIASGSAYWSISPVSRPDGEKFGNLPVGFDDDSAYLGGLAQRLASSVLAVPAIVRHIQSVRSWRYVTNLFLLRSSDLRCVSVWHPTFLSLLMDDLPAAWSSLLRDIAQGTCSPPDGLAPRVMAALARLLRPDARRARCLERTDLSLPSEVWPSLSVVSCWCDAYAHIEAEQLRLRIPRATIVPKGLISTEAMVSIPFERTHPVAINSHFFEFLNANGEAMLIDELVEGESYEIVVTTGGGLYRYRLHDQVVVTGFLEKTPCVRFTGRTDRVVDLRGEKLSEGFVHQCLEDMWMSLRSRPRFAMLAPDMLGAQARYALFVEGDLVDSRCGAQLDHALRRNPHYAYARDLGQLAPVVCVRVPNRAAAIYFERLQERGIRLGDIKPAALSALADWRRHFETKSSPAQ